MRTLWLKVWVWTKAVVALLLLVYVLFFVAENSGEPVEFWVWHNVKPKETVLVLVLYSFAAGIVFTLIAMTALRTYKQVQELRQRTKQERNEKLLSDMHAKAASLRAKPAPGEQALPSASSEKFCPAIPARSSGKKFGKFRVPLDSAQLWLIMPPQEPTERSQMGARAWMQRGLSIKSIAVMGLSAGMFLGLAGCQDKVADENQQLWKQNRELEQQNEQLRPDGRSRGHPNAGGSQAGRSRDASAAPRRPGSGRRSAAGTAGAPDRRARDHRRSQGRHDHRSSPQRYLLRLRQRDSSLRWQGLADQSRSRAQA